MLKLGGFFGINTDLRIDPNWTPYPVMGNAKGFFVPISRPKDGLPLVGWKEFRSKPIAVVIQT